MIPDSTIYQIERKNEDEARVFLESDKISVGGYAKEFVSSNIFSLKNKGEKINLVLVSFPKDCLTSEIVSEIKQAGYSFPEAQDAIWFGSHFPEIQDNFPVAFLHEPWIRPETGGENILILRNYGGKRYLHMHLFDTRWYSHIKFAVIDKK